jgi:heat shock protein HtpX
MLKRTSLFLLTNLGVLVVFGAILTLLSNLGLFGPEGLTGGGYLPLLGFAAVFGFGGSLLSLALSKTMAKRAMGVQLISQPRSEAEAWLLRTVRDQAQRAGIGMPEVGIFDSPTPNAFATGAKRDDALVAVSTGLLRRMGREEVEAVLGHEISHVANGDMVTLSLIQGVVNTFVIFFARIIGSVVDSVLSGGRQRGVGIGYFVTTLFAEMVLGILATMLVMWFSRRREFRADAGGAELTSPRAMASALRRLAGDEEPALPDSLATFGIKGGAHHGLMALFRSHPPIPDRIAALEERARKRVGAPSSAAL